MYILGSGCGWIPDEPVKFMYHIINLIKNLTPVVLIIMGSLDFGKAVISQKEEEIKRAQAAFIKKLIAGAAVFFVIVFARWVLTIIDNTGQADTSDAFKCVSLLLNGSYSADDKTYYDGSNIPQKTTKTTTNKVENISLQEKCTECISNKEAEIQACINDNTYGDDAYNLNDLGYKNSLDNCWNNYNNFLSAYDNYATCIETAAQKGITSNCVAELASLENYNQTYSLGYSLNLPCDFAETATQKKNCYSYDQYSNACVNYARSEQNSGDHEAYCQKKYCSSC